MQIEKTGRNVNAIMCRRIIDSDSDRWNPYPELR
jgi:hypothetical protein